jgi:hypothetical protein
MLLEALAKDLLQFEAVSEGFWPWQVCIARAAHTSWHQADYRIAPS